MSRDSITAGVVYDVDYVCRVIDPRDPPEQGTIRAYWTGEIDTWGKLTFRLIAPVIINNSDSVYLFNDEIVNTERCGVHGRR